MPPESPANPLPATEPFRCCRAGDVPHINMDRLMTGLADASYPPVVLPCKVAEGVKLPARGRPDDAGLDLSCLEDFTLWPNCAPRKVPTGVAVAIPPGYYGQILGRSGLGASGVLILAGVIDSNYRGPIEVVMANVGSQAIRFNAGNKVAQLVVIPVLGVVPLAIDTLSTTDRGEDGWGSSGR